MSEIKQSQQEREAALRPELRKDKEIEHFRGNALSGIFTASTEVLLPSPQHVMERLCAHFSEYGEVELRQGCCRIDTGFGIADVEDCGKCLRICATGKDEVALAYVKLALAEHVLNFADGSPAIVWQGDGAAGAPLPYFREMRVKSATSLTPLMRRLTLQGEDLHRFHSGGLHVRLLIPKDRSAPPSWPVMGEDGRPCWPSLDKRPDVRIYTLRRVDADRGEVDIDFVLHDGSDMPGARFAAEARPGDVVGMTGPGGGVVPAADWYLLAGDETALPAIARMLEELPPPAHAAVRIQIADRDEIQPLRSKASLDLQWLCRNAAGGACGLADAVRSVEWPRDERSVFAWAGCEHRDFVAIRRYLRQERAMPRDRHLVAAYWRRGAAGDEARREDQ
ncbi:DUF2218 domain-containing protein [Mesorhizobium sp. 1B3]|uniref:DUF2218 domain-containing protein n=1 Tax=Mesorhizobium sp. 1B3 TaxID=3243599 RepID=UPI003D964B9D